MHKGLYWSQLIIGIGIGLILASSLWIATEHISVADALGIPRVGTNLVQTGQDTPAAGGILPPAQSGAVPAEGNGDRETDMPDPLPGTPAENGSLSTDEPDLSEGLPSPVSAPEEPSVSSPEEHKILYAFVVDTGDSSKQIAQKLEAYGLISDSKDFLQEILVRKLERKLRAGHYELAEGESLDAIIAKLTR